MVAERIGQRIAEARPADVERNAAGREVLAHTAAGGVLLMEDHQERFCRRGRHDLKHGLGGVWSLIAFEWNPVWRR
jgi:hypothetical protein